MAATISKYVKLGSRKFSLDSSERVPDHEVDETVRRALGGEPDISSPEGRDHEGRRIRTFAVAGGQYAVVVSYHKDDTGQTLL